MFKPSALRRCLLTASAILFALLATTSVTAVAGKYTVSSKEDVRGEVLPDKALVYVLRPAFSGKAVKMWAFSDREFLGVTHGRNYTFAHVEPGDHVIWSKAENVNAIRMNLEAGKTYYLQQRVRPGAFRASVLLEVLTDEKEINKAFKKGKYVVPTDAAREKATEYITDHAETAFKTGAVYPDVATGESPGTAKESAQYD